MLQTLLEDRFKLTLHRETKQVSGYALVVEKGGPKFHQSALDADDSFNGSRTSGTHAILQAVKYSMDELASRLASTYLGNRPVENKTGLTGAYDIQLKATPQSRVAGDPDAESIDIFSAVREQLGLRLERQKTMIEMLVVDHVGKPPIG